MGGPIPERTDEAGLRPPRKLQKTFGQTARVIQRFPAYGHELLSRFRKRIPDILDDFEAVECLLLRYDSAQGANHDFHIDDTWLWGDRILGVTLRSPTTLSFYHAEARLLLRAHL